MTTLPLSALALYPASISAHRVFYPRPSLLSPSLLLDILHSPRILSVLVAFTDWSDLHSLLSTCASLCFALFAHIPTRDVLLSRFVPGYSFCLKHRDIQFYQDVPITIHDLDLLLISQRTDLHRYPTHALRALTAPALDSTKLVKLTQAHSRFVLLFQSLVHSSPLPIPPDPPEVSFSHDPSPQLTFPPPLAFAIDSPPPLPPKDLPTPRKKHKQTYSYSHPRLLSHKPSASQYVISPPTPSPLSVPVLPSSQSLSVRSKSKSKHCLSIFCLSEPSPLPPPPEEPETLRIRSKEWRRARSASTISASLPLRNPPTLNRRTHNSSLDFDSYPSDTEFDFGQLPRPNRLFVSQQRLPISSSSSSISISETRSSWNQGRDSTTSSRSSPPISPHPPRIPSRTPPNGNNNNNIYAPPFAPSIHSLLHATIRNRAPILRVFVPTQHMHPPGDDHPPSSSSDSSPERTQSPEKNHQQQHQQSPHTLASLAIQACESQLQEAGLWDHLSTGDVICNFGYIPLEEESPPDISKFSPPHPPGLAISDSVYTPKVLSPSHRPSLRSLSFFQPPSQIMSQPRKTWLIFTGHSLLPYTPPSLLPLPSSSPLSLPSPFYYYHILPQGTNPLFRISHLPPCSPTANISLALIKTTSLIPSTISHTGFAKVNKFAWTARALRTRPPITLPPQPTTPTPTPTPTTNPFDAPLPPLPPTPPIEPLGDGWLGEWIVEYEGTSEGRGVLLAALEGKFLGKDKEGGAGGDGRVWEVRRERSGGGRVWMRLLPE